MSHLLSITVQRVCFFVLFCFLLIFTCAEFRSFLVIGKKIPWTIDFDLMTPVSFPFTFSMSTAGENEGSIDPTPSGTDRSSSKPIRHRRRETLTGEKTSQLIYYVTIDH